MSSFAKFAIHLILLASISIVQADEISFNRDVRPILSDRCFHCHGPDANNQDSEFRLDRKETALADLGGYAGIVPGNLEKSELHRRIRSDDEGEQMPPAGQVRQLTESEKDILDAWIKQGAKFERHWSFIPLPDSVQVPEVGGTWAQTDIDRFVYHRITKQGLVPNRDASREKWLRRVTFDLTGLPPTLDEIDAFLADDSAGMYERVVDRLLDSNAFAERLASEWLDVARYSDSYGYQRDDLRNVWPYRDWVIDAFRNNMPYNEFFVTQLAGDLLPATTPEKTRQRQLATAFNRLHSHKKEGGSHPEEFRMEYVADRTNTFATAFLGLTFECARCHDHKYDPIKTKEYYQLSSFFSNIDEYGIISFFTAAVPTPAMPLPSPEQEQSLADARRGVEIAEQRYQKLTHSKAEFQKWLDTRAPVRELQGQTAHLKFEALNKPPVPAADQKASPPDRRLVANEVANTEPAVTTDQNKIVPGKLGNAILLTGDDAIDIPGVGRFSRDQPFSFALWIKTTDITERAVIYRRSRGWDDAGHIGYELTQLGGRLTAKLCHFWPGNAIGIETEEFLQPNEWFHIGVTYDGSSQASGLEIFVNGLPAKTRVLQDNLTRQITTWQGGYDDLAIGTRYRDRGFKDGTVDEFRVFDRQLSAIEVAHLHDGRSLNDALARPLDQMTMGDKELLFEYFLLTESEPIEAARQKLQDARKTLNATMDGTPAISIMRESKSTIRKNYVLHRGAYDKRGQQISRDTPSFLPPFPRNVPRNRLGLALWLTLPDHPLTARVAVNRYWQLMFGHGLVRTPEDFGLQGQPPTHPELFDWLARDFVDHGWDLKRLLKMIALSRTYRQSSVVTAEVRDQDPENFWLARGPGQRLSAEMIRDNALAVSGLLVTKTGGPPTKPYDLNLSFKPSKVDEGEGLYRRSLYTLWQRTAPAPVMMTMNANKREVCRVRREVTASPLQAFVLLNSPQFVEASRVLAGKLLTEYSDEDQLDALIEDSFRMLTSRKPSLAETDILRKLFAEQLEVFDLNPEQATALLTTGNAPVPQGLSEPRHAAATVLVSAIMNLDESVRHK